MLALSQLQVSDSSAFFVRHAAAWAQVQGEWGSPPHAKQNWTPQEQRGSMIEPASATKEIAAPQWGTDGQ